jgi:putative endonuclease
MDDPHRKPEKRRASIAPERSQRRLDQRRTLGRRGEQLAAAHLQRLGFELVEQNLRTRHGEIDLIAADGDVIVFAEVKTRRAGNRRRGLCPEEQPLTWLKRTQRARVRRLARAWLQENAHTRPRANTVRFDAIGVVLDDANKLLRLDHIEGAW